MSRSILNLYLYFTVAVFCFTPITLYAQGVKANNQDGIIRVLAIGNSFSQDGIEQYLHELASATGQKMIIGNLYIGGASLALHLENAASDKAAYSYRKIGEDGVKTTVEKTKLSTGLLDEKWDYISFQQVSSLSGKLESYEASLPQLYEYVSKHIGENSSTKYIYHQTWAYEQTSTHKGFATYDNNQDIMYNAIAQTSLEAAQLIPFDLLIPAGTAIQNARTSLIGDHLTRDGYHLNLDYGRFTAACAWYAALFERNVVDNPYQPLSVSGLEAEIAKKAAQEAVKNPFEVTTLEAYQVMNKAM